MVLSPGRPASTTVVVTKERVRSVSVETSTASARGRARPADSRPAGARAAAARAAARRRRVLLAIVGVGVLTAVVAAAGVLAWTWLTVPGVVLLAWLVTCRLAVRAETGQTARSRERRLERRDQRLARREQQQADPVAEIGDLPVDDEGDHTEEIARVVVGADKGSVPTEQAEQADRAGRPGVWDPVPVTLPTYVDKEQATSRTVRTIDLESTGVWTSGRRESDSALAREAEETERAERTQESDRLEQHGRATGS